MRRIAVAIAALMALSAPIATAQTVDEIVAKYVAAKGGMEKLKAVKTQRITGKMQMGAMEAPFVMTNARPNLTRIEFTVQGMTGIQAYDGKTAWAVMPFMGSKDPEQMSKEASDAMGESADFDGPLVDYKEKGNKVELVGKEKLEGTAPYKLKVTLKSGEVRTIYIDAESGLELGSNGKRKMRGQEVEFKNTLADYKDVSGIMFAHSMENTFVGAHGEQKQAMTIEKVEFNVPTADTLFAVPAHAKPPAAPPTANDANVTGVKDSTKATPAPPGTKVATKQPVKKAPATTTATKKP